MRVIAGKYRSRGLQAPRGSATRPTSDRLRETLFNVLSPRIEGAHFADLYAGSGAVGIEALSRGAARVLFVEQAPPALAALRKNLATLNLRAGTIVEAKAVGRVLLAIKDEEPRLDVVFLDPPYEAAEEYAATLRLLSERAKALLAPGAVVVAEHARRTPLWERYGVLGRTRVLEQGDAALSFFSVLADD